jgi:ABC-type Fe3+ transport system substrate-binding protein
MSSDTHIKLLLRFDGGGFFHASSLAACGMQNGREISYACPLEHAEKDMTGSLSFTSSRIKSALLASLATVWCGAPVAAQPINQLYALAKGEKALVMGAAGPAAAYESAARAFEQKFPGITVSLTSGFSNVLSTGIEEQVRSNKVETDLVILQTIQDFISWKRRGLLLHFKPDGFDKIGLRAKDSDGAWVAVNTIPIFYGYNTEGVQQQQVPALAIDFLRPQFRGRLISAYPADDDATLLAFTTIIHKYGWGYMDQYMKQQPKFVQGHLGVARSLGSGESLVSFDATTSSALEVQREGGKIALAGPMDDYLPVFFTAEAILKAAPHPNAAKLYVSWFLSKEWQSRTGVYSSRSDVPAPTGLPSLSSYRLEDRYLELVTNEDQLADLRKRFESHTGPVTNPGGVR